MRIVGIDATVVAYTRRTWLDERRIASPMSVFPRFAERRSTWRGPGADVVDVVVRTDEGLTGVGQCRGGAVAKAVIDHHLAPLLRGSDPRDVELRWEEMWRACLPYGRKGVAVMAVSGVDLALWDLLARWLGQPLYRVLGGAAHESLPVYATHPRPAEAAAEGWCGLKLPMAFGPADGPAGFRRNVEAVAAARDALGPDLDLMVDCFMAWDLPYCLRFADAVAPYRLRWIEEPLPPDDYDGYAELRRRIRGTEVATGEHEYTRWGFKLLLDRACADVLQPDLTWAGGITEARRIAALAAAHGVPVIPHAGALQPWTVHWMAATPGCPMAEAVVLDPARRAGAGPRMPVEAGRIRPSETPGAGVDSAGKEAGA